MLPRVWVISKGESCVRSNTGESFSNVGDEREVDLDVVEVSTDPEVARVDVFGEIENRMGSADSLAVV